MRAKPRDKHENWLLIKSHDEYARDEAEPDILEERPDSAATGRPLAEVAREAPGWSSKHGRIVAPEVEDPRSSTIDPKSLPGSNRAPMPAFVPPMLATLSKAPPAGERWLHEVKLDGYRIEALIADGRVRLLTRAGLDWTDRLGTALAEALQTLPARSAIIDGELVAERDGVSHFATLQTALSEGRTDMLVYYAFDLLYLDGRDLTGTPLASRKKALEALVGEGAGAARFMSHFEESGDIVLRHACRLGLEGVVSKDRDAPYRPGRGRSWIKCKCSARQEFVIGGFTPSTASAKAIGSLALGVYEEKGLRYVGRVGTGFAAAVAQSLYRRLGAMRIAKSPFADKLAADQARHLTFVRPELVAEVDFRAWTGDGLLRHASFRGLREDKSAQDIVREEPQSEPSREPEHRAVTLTHPDRLYWPEDGVTKEGLADYYAAVWTRMAPFVIGRALALVRCPDGIHGQKFFQKHAWKGMNEHISLVHDPQEPEPLIAIRDFDGLVGLVQSGALEIHPWGSTVEDWERPDTIVMDLDPGDDVAWEAVIAAAHEVRERLRRAGLAAFVKTSGGKGLHVVSPVTPKAAWPAVKAFTKAMADAMATDSPGRYVSTIAKAKRKGKILVDYLRNQRGATAVAAYSTRARPGAGVSMPLEWEELSAGVGPASFTILNTPARLASMRKDPWAHFREASAPVEPKAGRKRAAA